MNIQSQLVVICGPSGSGKSTIIKRVLEMIPDQVRFSVSWTTRDPRPEDVPDRTYKFVWGMEFTDAYVRGHFAESNNPYKDEDSYGTPWENLVAPGVVILDIDIGGLKQLFEHDNLALRTTSIFLDSGSMESLEQRLRSRSGMDEEARIQRRLERAKREIEESRQPKLFHFRVPNRDGQLDRAVDTVFRIVAGRRRLFRHTPMLAE